MIASDWPHDTWGDCCVSESFELCGHGSHQNMSVYVGTEAVKIGFGEVEFEIALEALDSFFGLCLTERGD